MINTTTLTLNTPKGNFVFNSTEVPDQINFGGTQMLNTHKLVGGARIIDALGPDDATITWKGMFLTQDAADRAQFIDYLRRTGLVCTLSWEVFKYTVIVSEFKADFKKKFWIEFSISCQVVRDETQVIASAPAQTPIESISEDSATAMQIAATVGAAAIVSSTAAVNAALTTATSAAQPIANGLVSLSAPPNVPQVGQVSTLSNAASSAIATAAAPLTALQSTVRSAIAGNETMVAALPTLGYINPALPMAGQVASLVAQCNAAVQLPSLYELSAVTTRMQANLALVANPVSNNQVVTGGGNLYQLAAQTYGDATRWTDIAQASGISDPMTVGFNTVTVPQ